MTPTRAGATLSAVEPHDESTAARARASAMPPEARRAAILDATVPLLFEHGTAITTRQIAAAAAVAEGTIFRVFADKDTLIAAAVEQAFDPAPIEAELVAIDPSLDLDARCVAAVEILQRGVASMWRILTAVGVANLPESQRDKNERPTTILHALASVLEPDRAHLSIDPMRAADLLRGLTFASCHPALTVDVPLTPREIVSVVLDGVRTDPHGGPTC
ncbi:MAG TPA: TetR/AcrR family transcriptional regulator [Acidimicrobiia bacterium]|nr:TetR/AcrR family transcriptional regulator [Acidimicrobiia bacterium]